jgi:hypothetical protein
MTSQWSYTITHYDASDSWSGTIIAASGAASAINLDSIPMFTDQGSGEVNRAIVRLNAIGGNFITSGTIIDQFDKIRIEADDGQGFTYERLFEVIHLTPVEDGAQGTTLQLDCLGNEWYLQHIHYVKPHFFVDAFTVADDIVDVYNSNIGSEQPAMRKHNTPYSTSTKLGNDLPKHTRNVYDYGTTEIMCYDALMDLIDRQGSSVDLGGVLDFFELGFDTSSGELHKVDVRIFSSGAAPQDNGDSLITIDATSGGSSVNTNIDESEGGIGAQTATRVLAWGELGSVPNDWARYLSDEVDFIYRPEWDGNSILYFKDALVLYDGVHYKAIADPSHTSSAGNNPAVTLGTLWSATDFMTETGDVIQYSPWTDDKVNMWVHMGSDPTSGTYASPTFTSSGAGMWDGNILINYTDQHDATKNFFRTWVHSRSAATGTGASANPYFYDRAVNNDFAPRGFRWLNDTPDLTGTDTATGKAYTDSVCEYTDSVTHATRVLYAAADVGTGFQVAVLDEGKIYEWSGSAWVDQSATSTANDCFHPYTTISNVDGAQEGSLVTSNGETKTFTGTNKQSAIEVETTFTTVSDIASNQYYKAFAGLCFGFPFPFRTDSSFSERNGDLFGSSTEGEPATYDPLHMHFTPSGLRGFNQTDSEEISNATALAFNCRVKYELGDTTKNVDGRELLVANLPIRVTCIDSADNRVVQDNNVPFRNNWADLSFPLNGFKVDRGSVPVWKSDAVAVLTRPKEQEAANVFEWRNLKLVSIQVQSFFDEYGRYNPLREVTTGEFLSPQSQVPMFGATVSLAVDALRFTTRQLASSGVDTSRNIEAPFLQRNQVSFYNQLKKDTVAQKQIEQFRDRSFIVGTQGKFDIDFGDSFLYTNPRTVYLASGDQGSDESENTIKLVAKKIEYSMTKSRKGKGGFIRRIHGVKRFT